MKMVVLAAIRFYQYVLSPFLGPCCRFLPSCSEYTVEAIEKRGLFPGLLLALKRLSRCHPGCRGGYDPLP